MLPVEFWRESDRVVEDYPHPPTFSQLEQVTLERTHSGLLLPERSQRHAEVRGERGAL